MVVFSLVRSVPISMVIWSPTFRSGNNTHGRVNGVPGSETVSAQPPSILSTTPFCIIYLASLPYCPHVWTYLYTLMKCNNHNRTTPLQIRPGPALLQETNPVNDHDVPCALCIDDCFDAIIGILNRSRVHDSSSGHRIGEEGNLPERRFL